jgi:hypothetical protein
MDRAVLQRITDRQRQIFADVRRTCPAVCAQPADEGVTRTAGTRVVDQVTGQIVEVVDARLFPSFDTAPGSPLR